MESKHKVLQLKHSQHFRTRAHKRTKPRCLSPYHKSRVLWGSTMGLPRHSPRQHWQPTLRKKPHSGSNRLHLRTNRNSLARQCRHPHNRHRVHNSLRSFVSGESFLVCNQQLHRCRNQRHHPGRHQLPRPTLAVLCSRRVPEHVPE